MHIEKLTLKPERWKSLQSPAFALAQSVHRPGGVTSELRL